MVELLKKPEMNRTGKPHPRTAKRMAEAIKKKNEGKKGKISDNKIGRRRTKK